MQLVAKCKLQASGGQRLLLASQTGADVLGNLTKGSFFEALAADRVDRIGYDVPFNADAHLQLAMGRLSFADDVLAFAKLTGVQVADIDSAGFAAIGCALCERRTSYPESEASEPGKSKRID